MIGRRDGACGDDDDHARGVDSRVDVSCRHSRADGGDEALGPAGPIDDDRGCCASASCGDDPWTWTWSESATNGEKATSRNASAYFHCHSPWPCLDHPWVGWRTTSCRSSLRRYRWWCRRYSPCPCCWRYHRWWSWLHRESGCATWIWTETLENDFDCGYRCCGSDCDFSNTTLISTLVSTSANGCGFGSDCESTIWIWIWIWISTATQNATATDSWNTTGSASGSGSSFCCGYGCGRSFCPSESETLILTSTSTSTSSGSSSGCDSGYGCRSCHCGNETGSGYGCGCGCETTNSSGCGCDCVNIYRRRPSRATGPEAVLHRAVLHR